ncbi:hypothetical protein CARUB_v10003600mg [Capsella rubella]|uniref:Bulb-type lectin domain-containing protein n=1 Tax=Capsella rubella TaxID=81985 RepID=R0H0W9_9BRAS|nr:hypothetical protein CARUB_v10003600mg [Capsella rubella]
MRAHPLRVISVFFFLFILYQITSSKSLLYSPEIFTVSSNQTLVSPGNVFELGLFKPNISVSCWYLGLWYKEDPKRTILWVANRMKPLTKPVGTLKFFDTNLAMFEQETEIPVWLTNLTGEGVRSRMVAELVDNGNFVIRDSEGYLWQSFDFPTDTLLPQMKIKVLDSFPSKEDQHKLLYPWFSPSDPSLADESFEIHNESNIIAIYNGGYERDTWNGYQFGDMPPVLELKEGWLVMKTLKNSSYSRLTIRQSDLYELYSWNSKAKEWILTWSSTPCYERLLENQCGSYSYCSKKDMSPATCNCIRGFHLKLERKRNDCVRKTALHCRGYGFTKLPHMKLPETISEV